MIIAMDDNPKVSDSFFIFMSGQSNNITDPNIGMKINRDKIGIVVILWPVAK